MSLFKKAKAKPNNAQPSGSASDLLQSTKSEGSNPYLNAKTLWNHQHESLERRNSNLIRLLALALFVILLEGVGLVYMGTQSKIKAVVAEVQDGAVLSVQDVDSAPLGIDDKIVAKTLQDFVMNWRSLTPDNNIEKYWITSNYAHTVGNASSVLDNYYSQNPPDQLSTQFKTSVVINNELKLSNDTYQVTWTENKESLQGLPLSQSQYTAQITYELNPSAVTDGIAPFNPFGVFIKDLTWSQNFNA